MIVSFRSVLLCPGCRSLNTELDLEPVEDPDADGHVRAGLLVCPSCGSAYIIEEDIVYLLPPGLMYPDTAESFARRHAGRLRERQVAALAQQATSGPACGSGGLAQLKQRAHFDAFAEDPELTYTDYSKQPVWTAVDAIAFSRFHQHMAANSSILDVGCGEGRASFQILRPGDKLLGLDVSRNLVRQAAGRAARTGVRNRATFLVADGSAPPIRPSTFDCVLTYGVLHHLPSPVTVFEHILRILKAGGVHFGCENNTSVFRKLFDALMMMSPLWKEEPGESPLMSREQVAAWTNAAGGRVVDAYTTVFVPPHLLNLVGPGLAKRLLDVSDPLCRAVPGLSRQGGLLMFAAVKERPPTGDCAS